MAARKIREYRAVISLLLALRSIWHGTTSVTPSKVVRSAKAVFTFITGRPAQIVLIGAFLLFPSAVAFGQYDFLAAPRYELWSSPIRDYRSLTIQSRAWVWLYSEDGAGRYNRGSGTLFDPSYIVTCAHIFEKSVRVCKVKFGESDYAGGTIFLINYKTDLAIVKLDSPRADVEPIPISRVSCAGRVRILAQRGEADADVIQTYDHVQNGVRRIRSVLDHTIFPGDSGTSVLNASGICGIAQASNYPQVEANPEAPQKTYATTGITFLNFIDEFEAKRKPAPLDPPDNPKKANHLLVVSASWCVPCQRLAPIIEAMAKDGYYVEITHDYKGTENIHAFPTLLFYRDGELLFRHEGLVSREWIEERLEPNVQTRSRAKARASYETAAAFPCPGEAGVHGPPRSGFADRRRLREVYAGTGPQLHRPTPYESSRAA